jgi:DNA-directed RNA polymerase I and III subunit RPAC2
MKKPEVEFCGYTTTHPSEIRFNLLIQTQAILPTGDLFQRKDLAGVMNVCQPGAR